MESKEKGLEHQDPDEGGDEGNVVDGKVNKGGGGGGKQEVQGWRQGIRVAKRRGSDGMRGIWVHGKKEKKGRREESKEKIKKYERKNMNT